MAPELVIKLVLKSALSVVAIICIKVLMFT